MKWSTRAAETTSQVRSFSRYAATSGRTGRGTCARYCWRWSHTYRIGVWQ